MSFTTEDRNPSPPPEILEKDENFVPDRIGSTVYSKRWVYKTLMNMLKVVQEYPPAETENDPCGGASQVEEMDRSNQIILELDPKIEEDACTLWDMSANFEIADFLCECNIADNFLVIIEQTKSPRLLEIVVGILGNMSSFNSTCEFISKNKTLVHAITMLSGCSDSCTLVQLFRLLTCGIVKENCQTEWFRSFEENAYFMENLKDILENNLCRDVLCGLLEFLDNILNYNPSFCSKWSEQLYILAVIESGKQLLKCNQNEDLDVFFTVVNTLCQDSSNVLIYGKQFEALRPIFHAYFSKLGEDEYLPKVSRVTAVISTFALYGNLLFSGNVSSDHIIFDDNIFKAMLSICQMIINLLINLNQKEESSLESEITGAVNSVTMVKDRNGDASDEEEVINNWQILLEAVIHAAKACISFTKKESELQILQKIIDVQNSTENTDLQKMDM